MSRNIDINKQPEIYTTPFQNENAVLPVHTMSAIPLQREDCQNVVLYLPRHSLYW